MSARLPFILVFVVFVIAGAWPPATLADPVANLHSADVLVHDQGSATRSAALRDALAQVLVKISGSQAVLDSSEATALLENPARFLQQYSYQAVTPAPEDPAMPRLVLHAEFDGAVLEQRLRAAGFPLWGRERPLSLAWIAFSDGAERRLVGNASAGPVAGALQRAAERRGLPLTLPAMDTADATRVSFMDVWGVYEEPLLAAAGRYSPDAVLVGSIFNAGDGLWAGRWTLLRDGERQRWELSGASPEAVATTAIDRLAEHFASEFAVVSSMATDQPVTLEVIEVGTLKAYSAVEAYLSRLSVVRNARLTLVDGSRLRFELELNGGIRALEQSIAVGRTLEQLPAETVVHLGTQPDANGMAGGQPDTSPVTVDAVPAPAPAEQPLLRFRYRG